MKLFKRILLGFLIVIIIIATVFILNGKKMYEDKISETSLSDTINIIRNSQNYVKFEDLPKDYINAVIAVEDHRFKDHGAIDPIAIRTSSLD